MIYLGIDPGVRSGIAIIATDAYDLTLLKHEEVPNGAEGFIEWWNGLYRPATPDLIIFEGFTLREGKHGVDLTPRDVIGALKANASRDGIPWVERAPAGRKKQVSDAALKRLGLYLGGEANRNAREAVRHVTAYLKSQKNPTVLQAFQV